MNPLCPYCGQESKIVTGDEIYCGREDLKDRYYYECLPCDAYVGTHKGTLRPYGTLANLELRKARNEAHKVFDEIWQTGRMSRTHAYSWLCRQTDIEYKSCHIGLMDLDQCNLIITIVNQYKETW